MRTLKEKFRHAFAVDPEGAATPTEDQQTPVDWICRQMAKRHLTTPGLIAMEMCRPLNYLAAQTMHFTEPAVWAVAPKKVFSHYQHFASFLERRGSIEHMCRRLEEIEAEYAARQIGAPGRDAAQIDDESDALAEDRQNSA